MFLLRIVISCKICIEWTGANALWETFFKGQFTTFWLNILRMLNVWLLRSKLLIIQRKCEVPFDYTTEFRTVYLNMY